MPACEICHIIEKLYQCCGRHPITGEQAERELTDGTRVMACPQLDRYARCRIYSTRPPGCRDFYCDWHDSTEKMFAGEPVVKTMLYIKGFGPDPYA